LLLSSGNAFCGIELSLRWGGAGVGASGDGVVSGGSRARGGALLPTRPRDERGEHDDAEDGQADRAGGHGARGAVLFGAAGGDRGDQGLGSASVRGSGRRGLDDREVRGGGVEITVGSVRDASARSIAAIRARSPRASLGALIIRVASPPQEGQEILGGAVPRRRMTSTGPSSAHRYAYRGIGTTPSS
jgi:hypothetical protein